MYWSRKTRTCLRDTATHSTTATHYHTLQHTAIHLQHTATHWQHTATHCNTLATHRNTRDVRERHLQTPIIICIIYKKNVQTLFWLPLKSTSPCTSNAYTACHHTHKHTHKHTHAHAHKRTQTHTHTHTYMHPHTHTRTYSNQKGRNTRNARAVYPQFQHAATYCNTLQHTGETSIN